MKSATSLLLGAALATAFFLLYTSVGHDLGARTPPAPRWAPEKGGGGADRPKKEVVVREEEEVSKGVVASSDDGGRDGSSSSEQKKQQRQQQIVMPVNKQQVRLCFSYTQLKC